MMRKAKRRKRSLVGWKQYMATTSAKIVTYSFAAICGFCGLVLVLFSMIPFGLANIAWKEGGNGSLLISIGALIAVSGVVLLWYGKFIYVKARKIQRVELITRHNVGCLPEIESLVRASNVPPTEQELLRATGANDKEALPDQLLRAANESSEP